MQKTFQKYPVGSTKRMVAFRAALKSRMEFVKTMRADFMREIENN
jgi:hypothetical protein